MENSLEFINIEDLGVKAQKNPDTEIIIWGTGVVAEQIYKTLCSNDISISFFGDSNERLWGNKKNGVLILSPKDMEYHKESVVIIGSFGYLSIYRMLKKLGIWNMYGILDSYKYPYEIMIRDREILTKSFDIDRERSECILLEIYGNIGDTILRIGIVSECIKRVGKEKIWVLVENEENAVVFRFLTANVLVMHTESFVESSEQRMDFLKKIYKLAFKESIILCDIRLYATRRYLNKLNSDIPHIFYYNGIPEDEYLLDKEFLFVKAHFSWDESINLSPQSVKLHTKKVLPDVLELKLPERYVVMHMGATKSVRTYSIKGFLKIVWHLNDKGFPVVLIGAGIQDEKFYQEAVKESEKELNLISLVSILSLGQSYKVIESAEFFVGTDSGMWNASYVLEKRSVVLYGGGEYGNFKHRDSKIHYVTVSDRSCFGCKWFCNNLDNEGHPKCIYGITPEMVIWEIDQIIK